MLREYLASSATWLPFHDTTFADYAASFPPTSVNVILQVGHNTLRLMTAGLENRPLTPDEMAGHGAPAGRGAGGRRLGSLLRPLHRAGQLRRRRRDPRPGPRPASSRRRLLHARARRGQPGLRGGARGDRGGRGHRRARADRAPQALRLRQLGRRRQAARRDHRRPAARAAGRLRRLSVRHRHQSAAESLAPLGDGERHPGDARAAPQPRRAHAPARRDRAAGAHQLRAHPVVGRRARGHLAAPARERRPHAGRHRAQPRHRSDRRRRRLHRGRPRRDAHPDHVDGGRRRARDHAARRG